jgi:hypothetical protein
MPQMPTREQLRTEFDAAVQEIDQVREGSKLTSDFYARIGDSVFEAGHSALGDSCGQLGEPEPTKAPRRPRLHVVSAPVGGGKTSYAVALIAAVVRLQEHSEGLPFGCLWVVDQMTKADEMYRELSRLLPGKVAVWSTDHNLGCKQPTKVKDPDRARFAKDDLQNYAVAIVTHAFFGGKGSHKARQVLHHGELRQRALTVIDERPDEVTVYDIEYSAAERVRELVKADEKHAETAGPHMDALVSFMHPRTFGAGSLEKPTDEQEAWKAAAELQWFTTPEASAFVRDNRDMPHVEPVFGFAKALAQGYAFIARLGAEQSTHFIGYENKLVMAPGMLLLDATADIDGVRQLCPWRQHSETPQARYDNLSIVHVPAHTKKRLSNHLKVAKHRRDYVTWMTSVIREQMQPGQLGLVVCKKTLFDNENIPDWPEGDPRHRETNCREQFCWDIDGRKLCAVHWGTGIGDNTWMLADVVFLFDEFYLPRRTVIATAQGLQHHKATEGELARMKTLNSTAKKVDTLQEGHLLRWTKQMALRGRGRSYDAQGVCGHQRLVVSGDLTRLLASAERLFPGASITTIKARSGAKQSQALALLGVLSGPRLPETITCKWIGQQMKTPWRNVGKNVMTQEAVLQAIENLGLEYVPGKGRNGASFRKLVNRQAMAA